jgi:hypothetical protein
LSRSSRTLDARRLASIWQVPVPRRVMVLNCFLSLALSMNYLVL